MGLFSLFNNSKEITINSPVNGFVVGLDKVPDNIFSSGMMGKGLGFVSNDAKIYSPCNGKVVMVASTKHAIGINANGVEILIHVGMDTCELNGEGLKTLVKVGDKVNTGDLILTYDSDYMKEKNIDMTIPMVITNSNDCAIEMLYEFGDVDYKTNVIKAKKNESN